MNSSNLNERFKILSEESLFSLVIFPVRNNFKLNLLFAWLILWSFCGLVFIISFFNYSNGGAAYAKIEYAAIQEKIKDPAQREKAVAELKRKIDLNRNQRVFLLGVIAFWCYYEVKVFRAYFFRKFGYEKIWMKNNTLFYRKDVIRNGKVKVFDIEFIKDFEGIDFDENNFFQNMSRSFWSMSGESIQFAYHSKYMRFAVQLKKEEQKKILKILNKELKRLRRT